MSNKKAGRVSTAERVAESERTHATIERLAKSAGAESNKRMLDRLNNKTDKRKKSARWAAKLSALGTPAATTVLPDFADFSLEDVHVRFQSNLLALQAMFTSPMGYPYCTLVMNPDISYEAARKLCVLTAHAIATVNKS